MHELVARGLAVRYGELVAVHETDLMVHPGQLLAVTGPSGAGKSSLLWALAGALRPHAGEVQLAGTPLTGRAQRPGSAWCWCPRATGSRPRSRGGERAGPPAEQRGRGRRAVRRTDAALALVGLEESGNHLIEELSGGQQQRVALARAFAAQATVLLADEPTSDLDAANRERVVAALRSEAQRGAVVVMATHDPEAAEQTDGELHLDEGVATWRRPLGRPAL